MFARTPRLLLRPGWMEDAPALATAIDDAVILRNLMRVPSPYTLANARHFLARPHGPLLPALLIFTRTQGAPRLVGGCGVHRDADGTPEIGYWIARRYWGLGFATEAMRGLLGMVRASGVTGIRACHMIDNPASGNVLRKIGFRPNGRIEARWSEGRQAQVDCLLFEEGEAPTVNDDPAMLLYADATPAIAA